MELEPTCASPKQIRPSGFFYVSLVLNLSSFSNCQSFQNCLSVFSTRDSISNRSSVDIYPAHLRLNLWWLFPHCRRLSGTVFANAWSSFCLSRFFAIKTSCFKHYSSQRCNLSQHARVRSKSDPSLSRKFRAISSRTCYMVGPWFRIFVDIIRYVVARPLGHYYRQFHPVGPDRTR